MDCLTLPSPAKVNLYLKILGRRPDGFHELETVMAALTLADELEVERRPDGVTLECDAPGVPTDASNLALRAALLLREKFGVREGAHIRLRKRTPVGGGLGGGSSNGATALLALSRLWKLPTQPADLHPLAASLGSDVPFFLQPGLAVCRGRGEIIEPLSPDHGQALRKAAVVLLNPGFGVPTPWAYRAYAARGGAAAEPPRQLLPLQAALDGDDPLAVAAHLYNSLEETVFFKYPILRILKDSLRAAGAPGALLSGSGATVFGLCPSLAAAEAVRAAMAEKFGTGLWTHVARFAISM